MVRAGVGEVLAADDPVAEILADVALGARLLALAGEGLKRLAERHARLQKIGKLGDEQQHLDALHVRLLLRAADLHVPDRGR